ncbi:MAG: type II toxin-antitoxin system prevent-host-death family antitoxin [Akkermansiaceae bacterium]|nr:type II toxin-antitoxin system prevent-host-death family antitoxin [Akkermansiaceae bacterium]
MSENYLRRRLTASGGLANLPAVMQVTIHQAKMQLSKLIAAVERGEEVIIARRDKAVVQLNPVREFRGKSRIGGLKGRKLRLGANFDNPALNEEIAKSFNG